ncbi:N-acetylglucosamine-6-phosphate deacetylase [Glaciimonas sp. PCH181]|uniref:N-acetylglucosamine-6-phosphate deacetylase n=1 Tax=Glaciimonas sp. PCH181 TaxID=2133943 RepID=UPI000D3BC86A|nr:N-acetylglucosamine-6-phosphate deacetylase [Glaciimonas sp. PCH181]PUA20366.1 N-acetylglucosamine-6-phosphate deacetylase [Glaciimonas sp. PCH181]
MNLQLGGNILTPDGWIVGEITFGDRIDDIEGVPVNPADNDGDFILPGFIDLHVHGGGGVDIMEADGAGAKVARLHARHGTTAFLATTMTAPGVEIERALNDLAPMRQQRTAGGARMLGIHLEGPYINAGKLGAQPDFARCGVAQEVSRYNDIVPVKLVTIAPEVSGHAALIETLVANDIRVQLGHTLGSYEDGVEALRRGAGSFAHLFNAMTGLHHREPGMVGAALAHADFAEIIPDLLHVHPGAIRTALRCIPHLYCVTDSTAAAGMPDGNYLLGGQTITKCLGGVRLADGTLAGSTLTMDQALRNLVAIGLTIHDASNRLSANPARFLGITDRGHLAQNCWADLVVFNRDLHLKSVYIEGELIDITHA